MAACLTKDARTLRSHRLRSEKAPRAVRAVLPKPNVHSNMFVAGALIGRGGEKINALCRETGARIEISRDDVGPEP